MSLKRSAEQGSDKSSDDTLQKLRDEWTASGMSEGEIDTRLGSLFAALNASLPPPLKRVKGLPSFSAYTWENAVVDFGLAEGFDDNPTAAFEYGSHQKVLLPKRIHQDLFAQAWHTLDVYYDPVDQANEAGIVRILEPYLSYIAALFFGRVRNKPEVRFRGDDNTSGGCCEYEFKGFNGLWLLLTEMKTMLDPTKLCDHFAQLMSMMSAAHSANQKLHHPQTKVFGILTDRASFHFLSYDGQDWVYYGREITDLSRIHFLEGMMRVSNRIFGVILEAYLSSIGSLKKISQAKNDEGDTQKPSFGDVGELPAHDRDTTRRKKSSRPSLDRWTEAEGSGLRTLELLTKPDDGEEVDDARLEDGIKQLTHSVGVLPRQSDTLRVKDLLSEADIKEEAAASVEKFFKEGC